MRMVMGFWADGTPYILDQSCTDQKYMVSILIKVMSDTQLSCRYA